MNEIFLSPQVWLGAGLIFSLRVIELSLDTIRVLMVMRGRKGPAWLLGFFQATIFVFAISYVLSGLDNPINMLGYAAGFAGKLSFVALSLRLYYPRYLSPRGGRWTLTR